MLAEHSNLQLLCSTAGEGLRNEKLSMEGIGEENSKPEDSPTLLNENPADGRHGVTGSSKKEENDDLHVKVGDCASHVGEPAPKLMSWFLDMKEAENELPPTSHSSLLWILFSLSCSGFVWLLCIQQ